MIRQVAQAPSCKSNVAESLLTGEYNIVFLLMGHKLTVAAGLLRGLVALAVRLPVSVLLSVLQAELVANLEGLADGPHDAHGVGLRGDWKQPIKSCSR